MKARKYQNKAVKRYIKAVDNRINPLIVSATGTGKTLTTALIIRKLFKRMKIV